MQVDVDDYGFTRRRSDYWPTGNIASLSNHLRPDKGETLDLILRQKIYLLQSRRGYIVNIDSHVLAYFVSNICKKRCCSPSRVLDLGDGVGLASIIFVRAHRTSSLHLLELQGQLVNRARKNLEMNELKGCVTRHDLKRGALPDSCKGRFDVVLMNQLFYELAERRPPRLREKLLARMETRALFSDFLCAASAALDEHNPDAFVAIIHDRKELLRLEPSFQPDKFSVFEAREMVHAPGELPTRILLALQRGPMAHISNSLKREVIGLDREDAANASSLISCFPPLVLRSSVGIRNEYCEELKDFLCSLPDPFLCIRRLKEPIAILVRLLL